MPDAFFSYSRRDGDFVGRLAGALKERGKEVWVDVDGVRDAERFPEALRRAIESSDAFVFVISPDSVASEFCEQEVAHAAGLNKRIVPLSLHPVPNSELPEEIRFRNWIPVADAQFEEGVARLLTAIETDLEWEHHHTRLTVKALEWDHAGRDKSFLLRGSELAAAEQWLSAGVDKDPGPSALEQEYLLTATTARSRRQRRLIGASLGVAAVAVGLLIFALISRGQAVHAARVAVARQLGAEAVSESRIDRAMLLAREAVNLNRDPQTEGTLIATLLRSPAAIGTFTLPIDARPQNIALRPDGRTLAVVDNTGKIRFYDPRTHRAQATLADSGETQAPTYSHDGSLLVYGASNGSANATPFVAVRGAHTLRLLRRLRYDRRWLTHPTADMLNATGGYLISPGDRTLYYPYWTLDAAGKPAAAYLDVWSLRTGRVLSTTPLGPGPVTAARLVAGGRRMVIVNARGAEVLDARSLKRLRSQPVTPAPGPQSAVDISPAGNSAVIGTPTGSVSFVDLRTGRSRPGVGGHNGPVAEAVYSPDGRVAVTTGEDQKVIVWDPATGQPLETLSGHAGPVHGVAFSADGKTLYTSSLDGVILGWDLGGKRRFGEPFTAGPGLPQNAPGTAVPGTPPLAVSPDGSRFAARIGESTVGLFSARNLQRQRSFTIPRANGLITAIAWSPRGSELAIGANSGAVGLWSVNGPPRPLHSLVGLGRSHGGELRVIQAVAFSPTGSLLAASDNEETLTAPGPPTGRLAIWRTNSGKLLKPPLKLGQPGDTLAFSKSGRELGVGLDQGPVWVLNPATGRKLRTLLPVGTRDRFGASALTFAPNGTLATGSWAGIVQLWNPTSGRALAHPVLVAAAPVASIAFDPSGRRFATTDGSAGSAKIWYTSTLQQQGSDLQGDPGQWGNAAFSPNGKTLLVLYADGKGFKWPTTVGAWEHHACAVAGRNLTREEWARFVSGFTYTRVCAR